MGNPVYVSELAVAVRLLKRTRAYSSHLSMSLLHYFFFQAPPEKKGKQRGMNSGVLKQITKSPAFSEKNVSFSNSHQYLEFCLVRLLLESYTSQPE